MTGVMKNQIPTPCLRTILPVNGLELNGCFFTSVYYFRLTHLLFRVCNPKVLKIRILNPFMLQVRDYKSRLALSNKLTFYFLLLFLENPNFA